MFGLTEASTRRRAVGQLAMEMKFRRGGIGQVVELLSRATPQDVVDIMLGKDTHAPGEVEDGVPHTRCGLRVFSDGSADDGGRVATPDRLGDVSCLPCRTGMRHEEGHGTEI